MPPLFAMFSTYVRLALLAVPILLCGPAGLRAGQALIRAAAESNVNQRYVIESVTIAGVKVDELTDDKFTPELRAQLKSLVGAHCDMTMLGSLGDQLKKELHLRSVREHLSKGTSPDHIHVNFEVVRKDFGFDLSVPKFLYHSKQGWTGGLDASTRYKNHIVTAGILSNGDDLTERFAGLTARYEDTKLGSSRLRFGVGFETYHEQWNQATIDAQSKSGLDLYRTRLNIAPEFTFIVAKPLTISFGASFERLGINEPGVDTRNANSFTGEIHYGKKFEGGTIQQEVDACYRLRAAGRPLGSDYNYTRHKLLVRYAVKAGKQSASTEFSAGAVAGTSPLFERFVLGSSSTLRGWNRYEIDALGGNRMAHNSLTYGYRLGEGTTEFFYDSGALWQSGEFTKIRHSLGVGYRQGIFVLTMAFPVRDGKIMPVFMIGMNY